ncbi:uncharacterized protein LTR77_010587 [Saxophila tyrrhenica]|uniref:Uncharacterized protein n=1 Tax=Saxophila tyrrhenica TaxID=1690608 RepID=A0AAV9NXU8_9PEZI|nr:hypothetical protein LTR77_010587 [Saxophila tyrrhenica]
MSILPSTPTPYALAGALLLITAASVLFLPTSFTQWLRKKNYQYEVTSSLYMLTPTEKFVFNSILFLTTAMLTIATVLYLPNHIAIVCRRAYYYFADPDSAAQLVGKVGLTEKASGLAEAVVEAAVNTKVVVEDGVRGAVEGLGWT